VSPARVPVIGYQEVIQGLSRDDVYSYYKLAYQPNNMVFSVAGDLDPEVMLQAVRKNVAEAKPGEDLDMSDIEDDLAGEPVVVEATEKVKPLRMKISKAKERALMKEFGLDEAILTEEEMLKRREDLEKAMRIGNNDHSKVKIVFETTNGIFHVDTTVWSVTENNVMLKSSNVIPIRCILQVSFFE
jgi:hypothetical protein